MQLKVDFRGLKQVKTILEEFSNEYKDELEEQVSNLAKMAYTRAVELVKSKAKSTQQDYINALDLESHRDKDGITYVLSLNPEMNMYEDGFDSYNMKEGLLNGPNAKIAANGNRYNTVPFEHQPYSKAAASASTIKLRQSAKKAIEHYGLDKIIKSSKNKALMGKVGVIQDKRYHSNIQGLTKYQTQVGKAVQSTYKTFRRVSDASDADSWIHPGFSGFHIFEDIDNFVEEELQNIINSLTN